MKQKYLTAFMDMAERFALTSEAERLKVGALVVKDGNIISHGVNGTPSGFYTNQCEDSDGQTAWWTFHAEAAALNKLARSTESAKDAVVFVSHSPCKICSLRLIDAGISGVYFRHQYRDTFGIDLLKEHGVMVKQI